MVAKFNFLLRWWFFLVYLFPKGEFIEELFEWVKVVEMLKSSKFELNSTSHEVVAKFNFLMKWLQNLISVSKVKAKYDVKKIEASAMISKKLSKRDTTCGIVSKLFIPRRELREQTRRGPF